jgi:protein TonB
MFDNYVVAKRGKARTWVVVLVTFSGLVHAAVVGAVLIRSYWVIEKVSRPDHEASLSASFAPPPPPPPAGSKKPKTVENKVKITKVKQEDVQPTKVDEAKLAASNDQSDEDDGVEGGVEGGVAGGVVGGVLGGVEGGVLGGTGTAPPPPEPKAPQIVQQQALEAQRISGEKNIQPPDPVKTAIKRDGKNKIVAVVKMCLTAGGRIDSLKMIKASGYSAYDNTIKAKMKQWKYRPFKVNGKAVPVCSAVTFIYTQK